MLLKLLIDSTGRVQRAEVLRDPGYGLGAAAARMGVKHFRFKPGEVHGKPVACEWTFKVTFELPTPDSAILPAASAHSP